MTYSNFSILDATSQLFFFFLSLQGIILNYEISKDVNGLFYAMIPAIMICSILVLRQIIIYWKITTEE